MKAGADISEHLKTAIGDAAFDTPDRDPRSARIANYNGSTDNHTSEFIVSEFVKPDCSIRYIVATLAFGMGVSIPDIRHVVIWGVPKSVLLLWQMIGRCARDSGDGSADFYATRASLAQKPVPSDNMVHLVKSLQNPAAETCARVFILKEFRTSGMDVSRIDELEHRQDCTNNCLECKCDRCQCCNFCQDKCPCNVPERSAQNV